MAGPCGPSAAAPSLPEYLRHRRISAADAQVALDDLREWLAWAREGAINARRDPGYGFDVLQGDAQAFAVLWSFADTLPFARRLRFERGVRALERRVHTLREERHEEGKRWREWSQAHMRWRRRIEDGEDTLDLEETLESLERIGFETEREADRALRQAEHAARLAESSFEAAVRLEAFDRLVQPIRVGAPRPRATHTSTRRVGGSRSGSDPPGGSDDDHHDGPADVIKLPDRRPKRPATYDFAVLDAEARGAEVE